jgi:uncharacterized protein YkwD
VFALAIGLGIAAILASPARRADASASPSPTAVTAVTSSPSGTGATASPRTSVAPTAPFPGNDAGEMLTTHNELRLKVGAPAVRADDRVTAAAQRHAEYLARNNALGHDESAGASGFSGVSVRDRLAAQGYPDAIASEVATSFGSGTEGVRSLWVLPYHRLGLMHPHAIVAGWGHAEVAGRSTTVGVIVYDFASSAPDRVRSPAADQRVAPSWEGEELPDVLPAGAARPVGHPVMVVYSRARSVELRSGRITDAGGREIAHHVVPQIYERDYVAIVPASPLAAGARYRVKLELRVGGADVIDEWEFATEP